jgi:hypothetical protein
MGFRPYRAQQLPPTPPPAWQEALETEQFSNLEVYCCCSLPMSRASAWPAGPGLLVALEHLLARCQAPAIADQVLQRNSSPWCSRTYQM